MRISRQLTPAGGWKFQQGEILIISETFESLVRDVTEHRLSNNITMGCPIQEVEDQICEANPSLVLNK